jgi:hypothetical protein
MTVMTGHPKRHRVRTSDHPETGMKEKTGEETEGVKPSTAWRIGMPAQTIFLHFL